MYLTKYLKIVLLALMLGLVGCSGVQKTSVVYREASCQVTHPTPPTPVSLRHVEWKVVTEDTFVELFEYYQKRNEPLVLFGVSPKDYENMAYNMEKMNTYVVQSQNNLMYYYNVYTEKGNNDE